uniref:Putative secreted protein n=1 Tax=Anopheles darlingi TaxID=43151 RepID=A0A2M4D246_ANODA
MCPFALPRAWFSSISLAAYTCQLPGGEPGGGGFVDNARSASFHLQQHLSGSGLWFDRLHGICADGCDRWYGCHRNTDGYLDRSLQRGSVSTQPEPLDDQAQVLHHDRLHLGVRAAVRRSASPRDRSEPLHGRGFPDRLQLRLSRSHVQGARVYVCVFRVRLGVAAGHHQLLLRPHPVSGSQRQQHSVE